MFHQRLSLAVTTFLILAFATAEFCVAQVDEQVRVVTVSFEIDPLEDKAKVGMFSTKLMNKDSGEIIIEFANFGENQKWEKGSYEKTVAASEGAMLNTQDVELVVTLHDSRGGGAENNCIIKGFVVTIYTAEGSIWVGHASRWRDQGRESQPASGKMPYFFDMENSGDSLDDVRGGNATATFDMKVRK